MGEVDIARVDVLRRTMVALLPDLCEIHWQRFGRDLCDVCAARVLVVLARLPPTQRVSLHYLPAVLTRLIQLLWPETCNQIRIEDNRGPPR